MNQQLKTYIPPVAISAIALLVTIQAAGLYNLFRFDRNLILAGEVWRILTGNLTHADISHWLLNMAGLFILWTIYKSQVPSQRLVAILLTASVGTCLGLLLFEPQLRWYVGLSGALHGLFSACIIITFQSDWKFQSVLASLLGIKLTYEQIAGAMPGSDDLISVPVVVNSHLYGTITGLFAGAIILLIFKEQKQNSIN